MEWNEQGFWEVHSAPSVEAKVQCASKPRIDLSENEVIMCSTVPYSIEIIVNGKDLDLPYEIESVTQDGEHKIVINHSNLIENPYISNSIEVILTNSIDSVAKTIDLEPYIDKCALIYDRAALVKLDDGYVNLALMDCFLESNGNQLSLQDIHVNVEDKGQFNLLTQLNERISIDQFRILTRHNFPDWFEARDVKISLINKNKAHDNADQIGKKGYKFFLSRDQIQPADQFSSKRMAACVLDATMPLYLNRFDIPKTGDSLQIFAPGKGPTIFDQFVVLSKNGSNKFIIRMNSASTPNEFETLFIPREEQYQGYRLLIEFVDEDSTIKPFEILIPSNDNKISRVLIPEKISYKHKIYSILTIKAKSAATREGNEKPTQIIEPLMKVQHVQSVISSLEFPFKIEPPNHTKWGFGPRHKITITIKSAAETINAALTESEFRLHTINENKKFIDYLAANSQPTRKKI